MWFSEQLGPQSNVLVEEVSMFLFGACILVLTESFSWSEVQSAYGVGGRERVLVGRSSEVCLLTEKYSLSR